MKLWFLIILYLGVFSGLCFSKSTYNLSDLQTLAKENNFNEFFDHALDIRPSERLEAWKEMVSKMADLLTQSTLNKDDIDKNDFRNIEQLYTWPQLRIDDVFKQRRQEIGLRYLKNCFKTKNECWKDLKSFWEVDKNDADLAIKLAELILPIEPKELPLWSLLGPALQSPLSEFYCQKEFVQDSIFGKLEIDYIRLDKKGNFLKKIDESLHPDCLLAFNKRTLNIFYSPKKIEDRELSYQILEAQGKADTELTDLFFTIYLLEKPSKGDLFNLSWNRLLELSKNEERRSKVLVKLKKLDPLPDDIFASSDLPKKKAIMLHFKAYFPEYLNFYVDQCLTYYGGSLAFKNGNPTVRCQQLMNTDSISQIVDEEKILKFKRTQNL